MTVKELKEILDACNDDALVTVNDEHNMPIPVEDDMVYHVLVGDEWHVVIMLPTPMVKH